MVLQITPDQILWRKVFNTSQRSSKLPQGDQCLNALLIVSPIIVSMEMNEWVIQQPMEEEVRASLFSFCLNKAPGPDGFTALFFQQFWPEALSINSPSWGFLSKRSLSYTPLTTLPILGNP